MRWEKNPYRSTLAQGNGGKNVGRENASSGTPNQGGEEISEQKILRRGHRRLVYAAAKLRGKKEVKQQGGVPTILRRKAWSHYDEGEEVTGGSGGRHAHGGIKVKGRCQRPKGDQAYSQIMNSTGKGTSEKNGR